MPFNKKYAAIYDIFYAEKNYRTEANLLFLQFKKYGVQPRRILDYGCGTGNYAGLFASWGSEVLAYDPNEYMLDHARKKHEGNKKISFFATRDLEKIQSNSVDACMLLFDVLSYMNSDEEISGFLGFIKRILAPGGLLIFDFWHGPGVIHLGPEKRSKEYKKAEKTILRLTNPTVNPESHRVDVACEIQILEQEQVVDKFTDNHQMRFFFKNEIEVFLSRADFDILSFGTWKDINHSPNADDWSALVVAQRRK